MDDVLASSCVAIVCQWSAPRLSQIRRVSWSEVSAGMTPTHVVKAIQIEMALGCVIMIITFHC